MLLESKNAIVYGGGGSVGGAVAHAFAREGARVFLAGRTLATLDKVAEEVRAAGGVAETAQAVPALGGTLVTWAAIEAQCRQWACELGPKGVRVVWLRTTAPPETIPATGDAVTDFGTGFGAGMTRADIIAGMQQEATMLDRLPTLAELGNAAASLTSDRASGMTATLANVTCGAFLD